ncbi:UTRA domain-containing protein [Actinocorallia sp. API 0066]|uniref:GntR family transcriptional regulator n=1 Tax=Actinocorallia sp. API 0066 TaxID=2896846 RepID=UPI001E2A2171|nr:UTRA domain-containing protein [Actinocorallia sp. API 0066]MCD0450896.1 UTRA domain-containing protein [Actinocorallia sp. API 0066]
MGAFDTEIRALGMTPRSQLTVSRAVPPPEVAEILGTPDGEEVLVRHRRMFADDTPVQIAPSYIPLDIAAGTVLEEVEQGQGGMISRLAELGHAQRRMTERVTVRPPTEEEMAFLDMSADQRVFVITHVGWTAEGRPVEVCLHVMPTHYWEIDYAWEIDT